MLDSPVYLLPHSHRWTDRRDPVKKRDTSVEIKANWEVLDEIELIRLNKLNLQVR